jgi:inner membrane protein
LEPVTHFLFGACLGRAGLNRKTALATLTLTLAAEAPDLDVLASFHGRTFGFAHHRGFTHSFLGVPLVSAVVVAFIYGIWRLRGRRTNLPNLAPRWRLLYLYACLAGLSHILLDFTNNYGVRPFWPFYEKWYSWDIVFIVEPVLLMLMILGLAVPSLFALVDREIGARTRGPRGQVGATFALIGIALTWAVRDYEHRRAIHALDARTYYDAEPVRVSAYPKMIDPFHWHGVVETSDFFVLVPVDALTPEVDPDGQMAIRHKPEETPITLAAKRSYAGRVFLDWAQYPITQTEDLPPPEAGYIVRFQDLRYADSLGPIAGTQNRSPLGRAVELDKNLKIVGDVFGVGKDLIVVPEPGQQ